MIDPYHIFKISLTVKAPDRETAERILTDKMNQWFIADLPSAPPYAIGSLLHYSIQQQPTK